MPASRQSRGDGKIDGLPASEESPRRRPRENRHSIFESVLICRRRSPPERVISPLNRPQLTRSLAWTLPYRLEISRASKRGAAGSRRVMGRAPRPINLYAPPASSSRSGPLHFNLA